MTSITRRITALGLTAAIAAGSAASAPAATPVLAGGGVTAAPTRYVVKADSTYAYRKGPRSGWDGTLFKGDGFKLKRLSPPGKWAYGMAYGHVNRHEWVKRADLKAKR